MSADQPTKNASAVLQRIGKANISSVMVVDDAFDPVLVLDAKDRLAEFWDPFIRKGEDSQQLKRELTQLCGDARKAGKWLIEGIVEDSSEITDDILQFLFDNMETYPTIARNSRETLFADKLEKMAPVNQLLAHLKKLFGELVVTEHGSDVDLSHESASIIFLDYYLGAADDEEAVKQAQTRISQIFSSLPQGRDKPFVVLMSSKATADVQRRFCEEAGLLRGLLTFAPKKELESLELLQLHLATWAVHLPQRHRIQEFVEALESSLEKAGKVFRQRIRGLGVEDYANIQWLSLQKDGQPLGDYMLWLFKSMLSHCLHDDPKVLSCQDALDSLTVDSFLPNHSPPSSDLAELYRCASMVPGVGPAGPHPQSDDQLGDIHLSLGDLFFREDSNDVLIVLNAACDLAYSPKSEERPFPAGRFVLFDNGQLQLIRDVQPEASLRMQPYKHKDGEDVFRINWFHSKAQWVQYGNCRKWLTDQGYTRKARMALPYALELQKSFANHITRVGMPIPPPLSSWYTIAICCAAEDGKWKELTKVKNGVHLIRKRTGKESYEETFVVTKAAVLEMVNQIDGVRDRLERQRAELNSQLEQMQNDKSQLPSEAKPINGKITGLNNKLLKLDTFERASDVWLKAVEESFLLPSAGNKVDIDTDHFRVYLDADYTKLFENGPPIVLNILQNVANRTKEN